MAKISDDDNIVTGGKFNVNKSQTLSNPKITDMNEKAMDEVKPEIDPQIGNDLNDNKNLSQKERQSGFLSGLKDGFIDTFIEVVVSGILLCITGLIFKNLLGFYIIDIFGVFFIILVIVSVLYPAFKGLYRSRKLNKTNKI
jgi:hypothetical protein